MPNTMPTDRIEAGTCHDGGSVQTDITPRYPITIKEPRINVDRTWSGMWRKSRLNNFIGSIIQDFCDGVKGELDKCSKAGIIGA